ncbi:MAG: hypothetical protein Q4D20_01925 [Clostridia bacterium]|nr:hypothetical protein [Clostridia bacterium]
MRKEKPIEKITVVELCKIADVNRSTFYRSFYDIYDLEEKIEDYCAGAVTQFFCTLDFSSVVKCIESGSFEKSIFNFDDPIALDAFSTFRYSHELFQKVFSSLVRNAPFLKDKSHKNSDLLEPEFGFVLTGALLSGRSSLYNGEENTSEIMSIAFSAFKAFYDKVVNDEDFDPLPVSASENCSVESKKERLNVKKTKKSLKKAFLELTRKKLNSKIGVSELCEKAEISNSTFYLHYNSIEDYKDSLGEETIENFYEIAKNVYSHMGEEKLKIKELVSYIEKSKEVFNAFNRMKGTDDIYKYPQAFADSFFELIEKDYCSKFDSKTAFSFVCNCAWGVLFEPFDDSDLPSSFVFRLAYFVFIHLFELKDKPKDEIKTK